MQKVLLIAPPFYRLMGSHYDGLHIGIAYIAAVLKEHEHHVMVYNADYEDSPDYANLRRLFESYENYRTILNDLAHPLWKELRDKIASFAPDIIGITMFTAGYEAAKNISKLSKSLDPNVKIVVGGPHPTLDPEGTIAQEEFDYVIRGEGEFSFLELVEGRKEKDILGLSYKKDGKVFHNESRPFINDLDTLPFPSRDSFLNDTNYFEMGYIITGRGCSFSCAYCASPQIWQRLVRFRSVSNVIEELKYLKERFSSPLIHFVDDTFNLNKRRTKEICQRIIDKGLNLKWVLISS